MFFHKIKFFNFPEITIAVKLNHKEGNLKRIIIVYSFWCRKLKYKILFYCYFNRGCDLHGDTNELNARTRI